MPIKEEKEQKAKTWVPFSQALYESVGRELVHFSTKAVNSNAEPGGVRLGHGRVHLPYVAVSTCRPDAVRLDYMKNVGSIATVAKQINAVLDGTAYGAFDSVPDADVAFILNMMSNLEPACLIGEIDHHLKQVIMPDDDGNDTCLTPLHSPGFSMLINRHEADLLGEINALAQQKHELEKEKQGDSEEAKPEPKLKKKLFSRARLNYGGANPQNIGGLVREMQRSLFFQAPREDKAVKKTLSIHYKGIHYAPLKLIDDYLDWQDDAADKKSTLALRETELGHLRHITAAALCKGQFAREHLIAHQDVLPADADGEPVLLDDGIGLVQAGLIMPARRGKEWREAFSDGLAHAIVNRKRIRKCDGIFREVASRLTAKDKMRIQAVISREVLS